MTLLEDITLIITMVLAVGLIGFLFKEYLEKRIRLIWLLIISLALGAVNHGIAFLFLKGIKTIDLAFIGSISFFISMYLMYYFFELFEHPTPSSRPMVIYTFLLGFSVAFIGLLFPILQFLTREGIFDPARPAPLPGNIPKDELQFMMTVLTMNSALFIIALLTFSLIMPIHVIIILNRIRKRFNDTEMQKPYKYMLIGFMIYLIGAYVGNFGIIARILVIIGQGLILHAFIGNKSVLISAHRLDNLLIINQAGLVLLSYSFPTTKIKTDELLLSGILTAITSSMKEVVNSEDDVELIQLGDLHLTIRSLPEKVKIVLISKRVSRFILEALDNFVKEFRQQFKNELLDAQDGLVVPRTFESTKTLVEKIFLIG